MVKPANTRKDSIKIILWSPIVSDSDCTYPENCWLSVTSVGGKCTQDFKSSTFAKYHKYTNEIHCIWQH